MNIIRFYKIGKFYNVYNEDAIIIHYYTNYKITKNNSCGFPDTALNKIINVLIEKNLSYQIFESDKLVLEYDSKINHYKKILNKSIKSISLEKRITLIINKLEVMNEKKLNYILNLIESAM